VHSRSDLWVSWEEYHSLIESLAAQIWQSGWRFDRLVCVARGGLRVGDVLSRLFRCPLDIVLASSYRGVAGLQQGELYISQAVASLQGPLAGHVLLVDDLSDSGTTLQALISTLTTQYPNIVEIRTAVLWQKAQSKVQAHYAGLLLSNNPWIHQPFETYDSMSDDTLQGWFAKKCSK